MTQIMENMGKDQEEEESSSSGDIDYSDPEDSELVAKVKKQPIDSSDFSFTERDAILYNLGVGATEKQLQYTFEGSSEF